MLETVKGELMPNILSAYTMENKVYMLPLRIRIPVFLTTGQGAELYSTLEALVQYSEREGRVTPEYQSYMDLLEILYYNYTPEIVAESGEVDRAAIGEFLGLVKRFCVSEQAVRGIQYVPEYWIILHRWTLLIPAEVMELQMERELV